MDLIPLIFSFVIVFFVLIVPLKHAFGLSVIIQSLYIVYSGVDLATVSYVIIFVRLVPFLLKNKIIYNDLVIFYLFFVTVSLISGLVFFSPLAKNSIFAYFRILIVIFVFFQLFKSVEDLKLFSIYAFIALTLAMLHVYTQAIEINPFVNYKFNSQGRLDPRGLTGQGIDANAYASVILWGMGMIVSFYVIFVKKINEKINTKINILLVIYIFVSIPIIGVLGSRSNMGVLLLFIVVVILKLNTFKFFMFSLFVAPIFLSIISINFLENLNIPLVGETFNTRIRKVSYELDEDAKYSRQNLANMGIKIFYDHPITGVGIGNEKVFMGKSKYLGVEAVSHNTFVALVSELGVFGIFIMIYFLTIWIKYINNPLTLIVLLLIGFNGITRNITLMSYTWIVIAFFYQMLLVMSIKFQKNDFFQEEENVKIL